jgi:hypothetical protein
MKEQILIMIFMTAILGMNAKAQTKLRLQAGDLLFRETISVGLSQAIDQVTQTGKQTHFSHVGLVVAEADSIHVLHASSKGGTCKVNLQEFSHVEGDSVRVVAYRLKKRWQPSVPKAVEKAYAMLGKPYNFSYILSDSALYCSEFIYKAFVGDSIFELNPMTFKDPQSGEFSPTWANHYKELQIEIPEGLPGCNPNGMAASEKLECLGTVGNR